MASDATDASRSPAGLLILRPLRRGGLLRIGLTALAPALAAAGALLAWQVGVQTSGVSEFLVPGPGAVLHAFRVGLEDGLLPRYAATTLLESLAGFVLGAAIALPTGYAIARSRALAATLEPYLAASQAVPAVALAPLLMLWLGYGLVPIAVLCALIVFFPAAVTTTLGFRTLPRDVLEAARLDGAGSWALLRAIEAPLAAPSVLAGLRASLTLSVTGAVVGEFVLGDQGLGGLMIIARGNLNAPLVFATLLALALLATTLYGLARLVERLLISQDVLEA
ncbi:MAG TPA: ABC transporter permease [Ktedonobacterales bacterium]|nr:ABC transporter permease [Ktedonobacterales bacterium]